MVHFHYCMARREGRDNNVLLCIADGVMLSGVLCYTNAVDIWQPLYSISRNVCKIVAWNSLLLVPRLVCWKQGLKLCFSCCDLLVIGNGVAPMGQLVTGFRVSTIYIFSEITIQGESQKVLFLNPSSRFEPF